MNAGSQKKGFALLVVLLVTTPVLLWCLSLARKASMAADISALRIKTEQKNGLIEGLLNYGVSIISADKHKIKTKDGIIFSGVWPINSTGDTMVYTGELTAVEEGKSVKLKANVKEQGGESVGEGACVISGIAGGPGNTAVSDWKILLCP